MRLCRLCGSKSLGMSSMAMVCVEVLSYFDWAVKLTKAKTVTAQQPGPGQLFSIRGDALRR